MTRRNLEVLLLIIAAPIVILLFAMMVTTGGQELNFNTLGVPLGIFVAFILAHIAVRFLSPGADPAILPISFALSGIGIAFVTRLAPDLAVRQLLWLYAGIGTMVIVLLLVRHIDRLARYKYIMMLLGLILLLSPLLPGVGTEIYGSRIWLHIGPLSFQPGELAKILIVIFLAAYLANYREMLSVFTWQVGPFRLPALSTLAPLLFMWAIALVIVVFEKDLGSALVFFTVFLVMLYVATGKKFYVVIGALLATGAVIGLYFAFEHLQVRVATWLNPFADPTDSGYQLVQATYSMADGGLLGVGIGRGLADQIPIVESDFIFAAIAEECGLLGAAGLLLLYLCFAIRGLLTAARAKSDVSSFCATGFTSIIVLQAFIIVGGVTRLIPLTGITLPFVSQGGSSLIASFAIVALLLRCGDEATGISAEMQGSRRIAENGVLGRVALGKRITTTLVAYSVLFGLLVANLTYLMVIQADQIQSMPGNNHTMAKEARTERGTISTVDGVILAQSVRNEDGVYERVYPAGDLAAHVVGYASTRYGTSGVESAYNEELKGQKSFSNWTDAVSALAGVNVAGNDVVLTINSDVQQAAQNALSGEVGACVVLNPKTGAVLAQASSPTYDVSMVDELISQANDDNAESSSELFDRATSALYAPGSTFKIVTLTGALENAVATLSSVYNSPPSIEIGGGDVVNINRIGHGSISLEEAVEVSSNTVFAQVGDQLGAERLVAAANAFGFDTQVPYTLPVAESLMPDPREMTQWETAWAAAGEPVGNHDSPAGPQSTVLEMALVGSGIANGGTVMTPYLVEGIYNANGERSFTATSSPFKQATSAEVASQVRDAMVGVVQNGTGRAARISGTTVAGKTGTAENGDGTSNIWFVGFAPAENPQAVIAMVVERSDSGIAAEKSAPVLRTALTVEGVLQ